MDEAERIETFPGRQSVQVHADGYYSQYVETYVQSGLTQTVLMELTEIPVPWYKRWWVWAGAVAVAGGVVGAIIYTGSSDSGGADTGSMEFVVGR